MQTILGSQLNTVDRLENRRKEKGKGIFTRAREFKDQSDTGRRQRCGRGCATLKRGEERRIRVNGTKRKRKKKTKKGGEGRRAEAWSQSLVEARTMAVCLVAPSSLSNTPSNIPSAITYSLLYTLPPYVTIFCITHIHLSTDFATYGRAWKHTLTRCSLSISTRSYRSKYFTNILHVT